MLYAVTDILKSYEQPMLSKKNLLEKVLNKKRRLFCFIAIVVYYQEENHNFIII